MCIFNHGMISEGTEITRYIWSTEEMTEGVYYSNLQTAEGLSH